MPLDKSGSKASVGNNIRAELNAGKPRRQAIAIALDVARRAKRATGGETSTTPWFVRNEARTITHGPSLGSGMVKPIAPLAIKGNLASSTPVGQAIASSAKVSVPKSSAQFPKLPKPPQLSKKLTMKRGGEVDKERNEASSHGPLLGSTRGRADRISTKVEDGSYIIPADIPSSSDFGQGNSLAGHAMLLKIFPNSKQGRAVPKHKGSATDNKPVDCALSDGEFRVSKADCLKLGGGDLDKAHRILDHMVMHIRHRNIESLKKLPGPAQD